MPWSDGKASVGKTMPSTYFFSPVFLFRPPDREVLRVEEDEVLRVFVALDVLLGVPDGFVELGLQVGARVEGGEVLRVGVGAVAGVEAPRDVELCEVAHVAELARVGLGVGVG